MYLTKQTMRYWAPLLPEGSQYPDTGCAASGKAIYFLSNNAENAVVAVPINPDGTLHDGTVTITGGTGSNAIDRGTNETATPDALLSQGALSIVGQHLFAVNAGSNTLTMMSISDSDPTKLSLVGKSVVVPGEFPNTVAASAKHQLVCVGTTGAKAGISCSTYSPTNGLGEMDELRAFDLGQTTPPMGPVNTVSHTFFSADETRLLTTVKGDPSVNNTGFVSVFKVDAARDGPSRLAAKDIRSSPMGTAVLFGTEQIPGTSSFFATDASFGGAILSLDTETDKTFLIANETVPDQQATCWVTISPTTGTAFVTDPLTNHIVEMNITDAEVITDLHTDPYNAATGFIDLAAAGNFVYALSPGNGTSEAAVMVLDVSGGPGSAKAIQNFGLGALGVGGNAQGMKVVQPECAGRPNSRFKNTTSQENGESPKVPKCGKRKT
ncbi:uncharacterized protein ATNIH1004_002161 [Aspergillus tanneri]|uniref:3-carboxymuconate cyclase n=1 Tax=Aspergillus tanneri TaxID=1220188 RepID=A0A5M9MVY0_9EURO|nr:uncharacterized protein ATNIH1004_002161 [Aspergillus tanneri]KAA8649490.1 hypothetical protein ATNIH1004_002161 [Aspergillus tanneri]